MWMEARRAADELGQAPAQAELLGRQQVGTRATGAQGPAHRAPQRPHVRSRGKSGPRAQPPQRRVSGGD